MTVTPDTALTVESKLRAAETWDAVAFEARELVATPPHDRENVPPVTPAGKMTSCTSGTAVTPEIPEGIPDVTTLTMIDGLPEPVVWVGVTTLLEETSA